MPRINLDVDFLDHPKTLGISPLAQLLFIRSIIYCARHLTDGCLPVQAPATLGFDLGGYSIVEVSDGPGHAPLGHHDPSVEDLIEELLAAGFWEHEKAHTKAQDEAHGKAHEAHYRIHDYLDYNLSKAQVMELIKNKKKAGRLGGQASAQARAQAESKQGLKQNPSKINPNPNTNKKNKDTPSEAEGVVDFETWWTAWPRKDDKKRALEEWQKKRQAGVLPPLTVLLAALTKAKASDQWRRDKGKYIPYPTTWLHNELWNNSYGVEALLTPEEKLHAFLNPKLEH